MYSDLARLNTVVYVYDSIGFLLGFVDMRAAATKPKDPMLHSQEYLE